MEEILLKIFFVQPRGLLHPFFICYTQIDLNQVTGRYLNNLKNY